MTSRRLATALLVALTAVAGLGCGNKEEVTAEAKTEGIWIDAGNLDYHVQGSRLLEPGLVPDKSYLKGLPADFKEPAADEVWFAVFLRIENRTEEASPTPEEFEIVDTEGKAYRPVALDTARNPFAYEPTTLQPNTVLPIPDSAQDFNSFSGSELLFKLPLDSYQNRPLEFRVYSADGEEPAEAKVDLDV